MHCPSATEIPNMLSSTDLIESIWMSTTADHQEVGKILLVISKVNLNIKVSHRDFTEFRPSAKTLVQRASVKNQREHTKV